MTRIVLIGAFGAAGALTRLGVGNLVGTRSFPYGTLLINVTGSFALGVLVTWLGPKLTPAVASALAIGFLGAFTTYSTFTIETSLLADDDRTAVAAVYLACSVVIGIGAAVAGIALGRALE